MLIESWIAAMITIGVFILGLISIAGWIREGERLEKQIEENKKLHYQVKKLQQRLAHKNALENIRVANEYYEECKKND